MGVRVRSAGGRTAEGGGDAEGETPGEPVRTLLPYGPPGERGGDEK